MQARASSLFALLALAAGTPAYGQLTLRVRAPGNTPADAKLYVAGSFNGWNPGAPDYKLVRDGDHFVITLPVDVRGPIEFKFTLGSWDRVELAAGGGAMENRSFTVPAGAATLDASVGAWRSGPPAPRTPTATKSVAVIPSFEVPQLGGSRRVWVYLPPDYATSNKRYPVLYMQDGQNVFDDATSFSGEWGVDEALDSLRAAGDPGIIVIAVDHGGDQRINEYSPWPSRFGSGKGDAYVDFLVKTLKPWADKTYRTLPDRGNTGVAGSSMGGLIAFYAALKYPDVFGRAGIFSPSFWIAPAAYEMAARAKLPIDTRFYIIGGALEGSDPQVYVRDQERMVETLVGRGLHRGSNIVGTIVPTGKHNESFWRREFPAAYQWLFKKN